jgi:hypothetical protein
MIHAYRHAQLRDRDALFLTTLAVMVASPTGCEDVTGLRGLSNLPPADASVGDERDAHPNLEAAVPACGPNGASCGTNLVCYDGACSPCFSGGDCHPGSNACQWGMLHCATGQQQCSWTANAPDRTPCLHGSCCGGSCVDPNTDGNACGPTCKPCPSGTSCSGGQCIALFGYSTEFSPCSSAFAGIAAQTLVAQQVKITANVTVIALGIFGNDPGTGLQGELALYYDDGGIPGGIATLTNPAPIGNGDNRVPVVAATPVSAGMYWIAGEFSDSAFPCGDDSVTNPIDFTSVSYPTIPNPFVPVGKQPGKTRTVDLNLYVVGTK